MGNFFSAKSMFGRKIGDNLDEERVNKFVRWSVEEIERKGDGLKTDALYRANGGHSDVQRIKTQPEKQMKEILAQERNVHVLTGALKLFFRSLEQPILNIDDFASVIKNRQDGTDPREELIQVMNKYTENIDSGSTLAFLFKHLWRVMHVEENKMSLASLGVVFGPTLMIRTPSTPNQDPTILQNQLEDMNLVVELLLQNYHAIFEEDSSTGVSSNGSKKEERSSETSHSPFSGETAQPDTSDSGVQEGDGESKIHLSSRTSSIPVPAVRTSIIIAKPQSTESSSVSIGKMTDTVCVSEDVEDNKSEGFKRTSKDLTTFSLPTSDTNVDEHNSSPEGSPENLLTPPGGDVSGLEHATGKPSEVALLREALEDTTSNGLSESASADDPTTEVEGGEVPSTYVHPLASDFQHKPSSLEEEDGKTLGYEESEQGSTDKSSDPGSIHSDSLEPDPASAFELSSNQQCYKDEVHRTSLDRTSSDNLDTEPTDGEPTSTTEATDPEDSLSFPTTAFSDPRKHSTPKEVNDEKYSKEEFEVGSCSLNSVDIDNFPANTDRTRTDRSDTRSTEQEINESLSLIDKAIEGSRRSSMTESVGSEHNSVTSEEARNYFRRMDSSAETNSRPAQKTGHLLSAPNIQIVEQDRPAKTVAAAKDAAERGSRAARDSVGKVSTQDSKAADTTDETSQSSGSVKDRIKQFS